MENMKNQTQKLEFSFRNYFNLLWNMMCDRPNSNEPDIVQQVLPNNIAMTKQPTKKVNFTYNLCEVYLKQDTPRKHLLETHPLYFGQKISNKKCMDIDFDGLNLQWKVKSLKNWKNQISAT